jgi:hypothetical protein
MGLLALVDISLPKYLLGQVRPTKALSLLPTEITSSIDR